MAKSSGPVPNLLRISGLIFTTMSVFHLLRFFGIVRDFHFTLEGSLVVGILLGVLAIFCFLSGGK